MIGAGVYDPKTGRSLVDRGGENGYVMFENAPTNYAHNPGSLPDTFWSVFRSEFQRRVNPVNQFNDGNITSGVIQAAGWIAALPATVALSGKAAAAYGLTRVTAGALALYAAKNTATSTIATGVEWAVADYLDDESFDPVSAFGRNLAIDTVTGWVPGAAESRLGLKATALGVRVGSKLGRYGTQAGRWAARYGVQYASEVAIGTSADVAWSVGIEGRGIGESLIAAGAGNLVGQGVGDLLSAGIRRSMGNVIASSRIGQRLRWCFVADTPVLRNLESEDVLLVTPTLLSDNERDSTFGWFVGGVAALAAGQALRACDRRRRTRLEQQATDKSMTESDFVATTGPSDHDTDDMLFEAMAKDLAFIEGRREGDLADMFFDELSAFNPIEAGCLAGKAANSPVVPVVVRSLRDRLCDNDWPSSAPQKPSCRASASVPVGCRMVHIKEQKRGTQMITLLRKLMLLSCLVAAGVCFWKALPDIFSGDRPIGTPVARASLSRAPVTPSAITTPIQDLRVGMRVVGRNPLAEDAQRDLPQPEPETWRLVRARIETAPGKFCDVELLRPREWIIDNQAEAGATIWLELPEMFVAGEAEVLAIEASPPIEAGTNPITTGTFRHEAERVVDVHVEGNTEPIGCTPEHPFWSTTREDFIAASELEVGERVFTAYGNSARITSIIPRAGPQTVHGLEVCGEHVYHVGDQGLLVHNASWRDRRDVAFRSLSDSDIDGIQAGRGISAPGTKRGVKHWASVIANDADDTAYIPTTEQFGKLWNKESYIVFRKDRVKYISQKELLGSKAFKREMPASKFRFVQQQAHSLVADEIPIDAMVEIVIKGERLR